MHKLVRRILRRWKKPAPQGPTKQTERPPKNPSIAEVLKSNPRSVPAGALDDIPVKSKLGTNIANVQQLMGSSADLVIRHFPTAENPVAVAVFLQTMSQGAIVSEEIVKPLVLAALEQYPPDGSLGGSFVTALRERLIHSTKFSTEKRLLIALEAMVEGYVVCFIDGSREALVIDAISFEKRAIIEPATEAVVRGPRQGFTESISTNLSLIRRRLGTPLLRLETMKIGRWTKTKVAVVYVHGLAGAGLVHEVKARLSRIDLDGIVDSGYLEEYIEDSAFSPFPQTLPTERPDTVVAQLLEGRVAVLSDGSPFALVVPVTFWSLMQASEDYYERWHIGTFIRLLRFVLMFLVMMLPSLYVAATTFHPEILPSALLRSIAAAREGVPFSTFGEVLLLELTFEALREAGVRLPRPVGQTISIVGALVIGQSAVQAQIVSAPVVIIVAFTGVASFAIPHFNFGIAMRLIRFPVLFLAASLGLFGITIGIMLTILHLVTLRSFGLPYLTPVSPFRMSEMKDTFIRVPWWRMFRRPHIPASHATWRQDFPQKPHPPDNGD